MAINPKATAAQIEIDSLMAAAKATRGNTITDARIERVRTLAKVLRDLSAPVADPVPVPVPPPTAPINITRGADLSWFRFTKQTDGSVLIVEHHAWGDTYKVAVGQSVKFYESGQVLTWAQILERASGVVPAPDPIPDPIPDPPPPDPDPVPVPTPIPGGPYRAVLSDGTELTETAPRKGAWYVQFRKLDDRLEVVVNLGECHKGTAANGKITGWKVYAGANLIGTKLIPGGIFNYHGRSRWESSPEPIRAGAIDKLVKFSTAGFANVKAAGTATYEEMGFSELENYQPQTGGRPDIGLYTGWAVQYLANPTPANEATLRAIAEAAGSMPCQLLDENTGKPIDPRQYPLFGHDFGATPGRWPNTPNLQYTDTGWTLDSAHFPDVSYPMAVLTGGLYHIENLQMQTLTLLGMRDTNYREGGKFIIRPLQVRDLGWVYRMIARCAAVTPVDGGPSLLPKKVFTDILENNRQWFIANIMKNPDRQYSVFHNFGELGNAPAEGGAAQGTVIKFFQMDYVSQVFEDIVRIGFTEWTEQADYVLDPLLKLTAQPMRPHCCEYLWAIRETKAGPIFASWADSVAFNLRIQNLASGGDAIRAGADNNYVGELYLALTLAKNRTATAKAAYDWVLPQAKARLYSITQVAA